MPRHETVIAALETGKRVIIPTTFVALAPDRISLDGRADLLFGVFHIMWQDMPRPRAYHIRISEYVSGNGNYLGCYVKYDTQLMKC